jgi:glycosyltransferase involved in cell wall biosynthesis
VEIIKGEVPDVRAIIVGDGPEMGRLRTMVREQGLETNVEFTGFLEDYDDALALMKSSRVFASPSTREGFGMAALEANACGLPVVTVRHRMNAVSDLVTERSGLLCELSEKDLAGSILLGLDRGSSMREGCLQSAKRYDWDAICLLAEEVYES